MPTGPSPSPPTLRLLQRRTFLANTARGVGALALAALLPRSAVAAAGGLPNYPAKAKRVIWLCMAGGPSHLETFDYKPILARMHGQAMPASFTKGQPIAQLQGQ